MRWVTRHAIIGAALGLGLVATLGFIACHGPRPEQPGPAASSEPTPRTGAARGDAAVPPPALSAPDAAPNEEQALAAAVATAKSCSAPTSTIINPPGGGVVFVNAWHRKDAGNIDRLQGIVGVLTGQSAIFRCCFDAWTAERPGRQGTLLLRMELEADGAVKSASIDANRTDIDQAVTRACVIEVAKGLTYPESPAKHATLVEYPFVVQDNRVQEGSGLQDGSP